MRDIRLVLERVLLSLPLAQLCCRTFDPMSRAHLHNSRPELLHVVVVVRENDLVLELLSLQLVKG